MTAFIAFLLSTALVAWVSIFGFASINAGRTGGILHFIKREKNADGSDNLVANIAKLDAAGL